MFNKPIELFKIRQELRFYAEGLGSKFINKITGIAPNTINKYLLLFDDTKHEPCLMAVFFVLN